MFRDVCVVGAGRAGSTIAARLAERGLAVRTTGRGLNTGGAELVLLCVPDRAIAEVAAVIEPGPWVAHVSGATSLAALDPHRRRFSVHPLQTLVLRRGPDQLDGAWAAVTAESDEARALGFDLARLLGLEPFALADGAKPLYHAAASFACAFLVPLWQAASTLFEQVGAPPDALLPLMRRTIDNGFELTGPIRRGDWATVDAHLAALGASRPELEPLYRALAEATAP